MTNGHEGLSGRSSWNVVFKVKFESDMFPGFGYDPMDIVKSLQKGIKELLPHYVESVEVSETDWDVDEDEPDQFNRTSDRTGEHEVFNMEDVDLVAELGDDDD